ncbi:unknown [Salmonella phage FelixO1]|uniref:Uncharacterized protein n=1 Tax=Salmonella phage Felix O1 (isolate Felix O1-VT1) TaxID=1283336 RepID=Q6KGU3_BPFO1|nr:unknown [Salmonella phage FelixO1]
MFLNIQKGTILPNVTVCFYIDSTEDFTLKVALDNVTNYFRFVCRNVQCYRNDIVHKFSLNV